MVCLRLKPGVPRLNAHTNPLSYRSKNKLCFVVHLIVDSLSDNNVEKKAIKTTATVRLAQVGWNVIDQKISSSLTNQPRIDKPD